MACCTYLHGLNDKVINVFFVLSHIYGMNIFYFYFVFVIEIMQKTLSLTMMGILLKSIDSSRSNRNYERGVRWLLVDRWFDLFCESLTIFTMLIHGG